MQAIEELRQWLKSIEQQAYLATLENEKAGKRSSNLL
jgi:hypothetical protein